MTDRQEKGSGHDAEASLYFLGGSLAVRVEDWRFQKDYRLLKQTGRSVTFCCVFLFQIIHIGLYFEFKKKTILN